MHHWVNSSRVGWGTGRDSGLSDELWAETEFCRSSTPGSVLQVSHLADALELCNNEVGGCNKASEYFGIQVCGGEAGGAIEDSAVDSRAKIERTGSLIN